MSKWVITDGATGCVCIIPKDTLLDNRLAYGCVVYKEIECCGLLEAIKALHTFEEEEEHE